MAVRKIAISVPEDVLKQVDRLAKRAKTTRSALISQVLGHISRASSQKEMIAQINEIFSDPEVAAEQIATSNYFLHSPKASYGDTEW